MQRAAQDGTRGGGHRESAPQPRDGRRESDGRMKTARAYWPEDRECLDPGSRELSPAADVRSFAYSEYGHGRGSDSIINAAPMSAAFFVKLTISPRRCAGSAIFQKSCITGVTTSRNRAMSTSPTSGRKPTTTLEPATTSHNPEMIALAPGIGTCLYAQYPRIAA